MRLFGKKRPAKKNENQPSLRKRCFGLFQEGRRPAAVARTTGASPRTVYRYFQDYRALHHMLPYSVIRRWVRKNPEFSEKVITMLATTLGMSREEVVARAQKPWGLLQGIRGEWPNYRLEKRRTEIENRLLGALEIVKFIEIFSQKNPEFVREVLKQLILDRGGEVAGT